MFRGNELRPNCAIDSTRNENRTRLARELIIQSFLLLVTQPFMKNECMWNVRKQKKTWKFSVWKWRHSGAGSLDETGPSLNKLYSTLSDFGSVDRANNCLRWWLSYDLTLVQGKPVGALANGCGACWAAKSSRNCGTVFSSVHWSVRYKWNTPGLMRRISCCCSFLDRRFSFETSMEAQVGIGHVRQAFIGFPTTEGRWNQWSRDWRVLKIRNDTGKRVAGVRNFGTRFFWRGFCCFFQFNTRMGLGDCWRDSLHCLDGLNDSDWLLF